MRIYIIFFLVVIGVLIVYNRKNYFQIGDTCGFYAIVFAVSLTLKINRKKSVKKMIKESIRNGDSYVGEIFNIYRMKKIAEKYFPKVDFCIEKISTSHDVDKLLENYYLIFPLIWDEENKIPHYVVLTKKSIIHKREKYEYHHAIFKKKRFIDKEIMIKNHNALKENSAFVWKMYFKEENKRILHKYHYLVYRIKVLFSDNQLYTYLQENKKKKEKEISDLVTEINMHGTVLCVPKK